MNIPVQPFIDGQYQAGGGKPITLVNPATEQVLASAQQYGIAHLLTLLQPDSRRQKRIDTRFPGIHHFDEIMPGDPQP